MKASRKIKALSPVISVLLLVIMAAVASVMLYVWFSGYFSTQATKATELAGLSITIQNVMFTNYDTNADKYKRLVVVASIHNFADETVNITSIKVQVDGKEPTSLALTPNVDEANPLQIQPGGVATIAFTCDIEKGHGEAVTIVIMASGKGVSTEMPYNAAYAYSATAP